MRFDGIPFVVVAAIAVGGCAANNSKSNELDASTANAGGNSSNQGQPQGGGGGATSTGSGTLWLEGYLSLKGVDIATGQVKVTSGLLTGGAPDIFQLATDAKHVWGGLADGSVLVLDKSSGDYSTIPIDTGETWGIDSVTAANGTVYVGSGARPSPNSEVPPPLVQIDATTLQVKARTNIFGTDFNQSIRRISVDANAVWVMAYPGFALEQLNLQTLAVENTIFLGENLNNPTGARQDGYGDGDMVQIGNLIWAVDWTSARLPLLKIDKTTGQVAYVRALTDEFGAKALDCLNIVANQASFFILFGCLATPTIARFDGLTGNTLQTYVLDGDGGGALAVKDQKLYLHSPTSDRQVLEIDVASGAQRIAYTDSGLVGPLTVE